MNTTQFLYGLYWKILGILNPDNQPNLFSWGVKKQIFAEDTKYYENLKTKLFDVELTTPIGISADMDIDVTTMDALIQQGAGFCTFGSYTLRPIPDHKQTLYYKNGRKMNALKQNLQEHDLTGSAVKLSQRRYLPHFVGISMLSYNADEMKIGNGEERPGYLVEYELMTQKAAPSCDFLVINISHPSMPLYQLLSDESSMRPLIETIQQTAQISAPISTPKILLKVPYDITPLEVKSLSQIALKTGLDGIIISGHGSLQKNMRLVLSKGLDSLDESAFICGCVLRDGMIKLVQEFRKRTHGCIPLIASDSIKSGQDVFDLLAAGASAVEVGTLLFTQGPTAVQKLNAELSKILREKGIRHISDVIGINSPLDPNVQIEDLFN